MARSGALRWLASRAERTSPGGRMKLRPSRRPPVRRNALTTTRTYMAGVEKPQIALIRIAKGVTDLSPP
jgi:hypothetical protein